MLEKKFNTSADFSLPNLHKYPWWQGAIIYQIYPRSFYDTSQNGVGDLRGIIKKMGYIADLGVDAIWISPFFCSPMKDFGYDISDYRNVDPLFGSLKDIDELINTAHSYGLKVMIDQVLSHTSDEHEWFKTSRQGRKNEKSDWYVWAEPAENGGPPNNWLSIFGGSAWEWCDERQQYYFHNFLKSQPDLNFHCEPVRQQILQEVEYWLERGVDGLRLDAINFCYHDKQLRDNPPKPEEKRSEIGFCKGNPYTSQIHIYDNTQKENIVFLEDLRRLMDRYPSVVSLGEINSENSLQTIAEYTKGDKRLHMGYSFELLAAECSPEYIRNTVETLQNHMEASWPCWAISNHDVERVLSRWGDGANPELAKLFTALVCSLRGAVCTYQGEELGLPEASLSREQIQDPYGREFWPEYKGRDGCRTPMPWVENGNTGAFSQVEPWLPIPDLHSKKSVSCQQIDESSVLNAYRCFLHWRKNISVLRYGSIEFIDIDAPVLAFLRILDRNKLLVIFNLTEDLHEVCLLGLSLGNVHAIKGFRSGKIDGNKVLMRPYSLFFCELDE